MSNACPCCGAPVPVDAWDEALAQLSPQQRRIAEIVARRPGLPADDLAQAVHAGDPDGGPLTAARCVMTQIHRVNAKLGGTGFRISAGRGRRWGYRVETGDRA